MIPVISIVGKKNVGKTTFLEKLIPELSSRGIRVGCVKHDAHGFDIDTPGKDTWRLKRAGSKAVMIASDFEVALMEHLDEKTKLDKICCLFDGMVDIILTEGYKKEDKPKIEVSRKALSQDLISRKEDNLIGVVSDHPIKEKVRRFSLDDANGVAGYIEEKFLKTKCNKDYKGSVALKVNGKRIGLNPFLQGFMKETIFGMLKSLKGVNNPKQVELKIGGVRCSE